jgi:hypothetical protein
MDPRPNASTSDYSTFLGNPIFCVDILGDTVWTNRDGFNLINMGLTAVLGDTNPFSFDEKKGVVTMLTNEVPGGLDAMQMEVYQRMRHLVTSDIDKVRVYAVDRDKTAPGQKQSLVDKSKSGFTLNGYSEMINTVIFKGMLSLEVGTQTNVYIANNPQRKVEDVFDGKSKLKDLPSYYRGIVALHELLGHTYSRANNRFLSRELNNYETEQFEERLGKSGAFKVEGRSINWDAEKHEK